MDKIEEPEEINEIKEIPSIDWKEIGEPFEDLLKATSNLLEREFPLKYISIPDIRLFFIGRFRIALNTYSSIFYLCADTPKDPLRDKRFQLSVSPLVRVLFEELITVLFVRHDIPKYTNYLFKTEFREVQREIEFAEKYHSGKPLWDEYIEGRKKRLKYLEKAHSMTADEFIKIGSYPTPRGLRNKIDSDFKKNSQFLSFYDFIDSWMYRELSLSSHGDIQNTKTKTLYFSKRIAKANIGENYKEVLDDYLRKNISKIYFTVATLLMAIMTELYFEFNFDPRYNMKPRLKQLWEKLITVSDIAKDFYDYRYKDISK